MKHLFLSHQLSISAKENGFNESCICYYERQRLNEIGNDILSGVGMLNSDEKLIKNPYKDFCTAPLYSQIKDWFRDKHNIHIEIYCNASGWGYILTKLNGTTIKEIEDDIFFEDYYKALNKGIEESFKLI